MTERMNRVVGRPRRLHSPRGTYKPSSTILIRRPYRYGNPFDWREHGRAGAVEMHAAWIVAPDSEPIRLGKIVYLPASVEEIRGDLQGFNLGCNCPEDGEPCHGETLLAIANGDPQ